MMRNHTRVWTLALCLSVLFPALALAGWVEAGRMHLSYAPDAVVTESDIEPLQPFEFYLLLEDSGLGSGVMAYEAAVSLHASILFQSIALQPSSSINFGNGFAEGQIDLLVGTGACSTGGEYLVLAKFTAVTLAPVDNVFIGLGPHPNSSVGGEAAAWLGCDSQIYATESDPVAAVLWLNRTDVANDAISWGSVKGRFH